MLVRHTREDEIVSVVYYLLAECICDRCHRKFFRKSDNQDEEISEEEEKEFLNDDFAVCSDCRLDIARFQQKQKSII